MAIVQRSYTNYITCYYRRQYRKWSKKRGEQLEEAMYYGFGVKCYPVE